MAVFQYDCTMFHILQCEKIAQYFVNADVKHAISEEAKT